MADTHGRMDRRRFLAQSGVAMAGASLLVPPMAQADDLIDGGRVPDDRDHFDFLLGRICNINPAWDYGPGGDKNLLEQFSDVMRCKVKLQENVRDEFPEQGRPEHFNGVVDLSNLDTMRKFPILFMTGMGGFDLRDPKKLENLQAYIEEGGFLLMDECVHPGRTEQFYQSSLRALQRIFEASQIRRIPEEHEVYRNVYDISEPGFRRWRRGGVPTGTTQRSRRSVGSLASPGNTGVFIGERLAVFLCDADIHCGWTDPRDSWIKRAGNREGIQTGTNILTYFLSH